MRNRTSVKERRARKAWCNKKVDMLKNDMFGKGMSMKDLKKMKCKQVTLNVALFLTVLLIIKVFYEFQPDHYALSLPSETDLTMNTNLRSSGNLAEHHTVRRYVIELLEKHCKQHEDYHILFCHNVQLNSNPIFSPCFMTCSDLVFYNNLEIIETTDDDDTITCHESYSTIRKTIKRKKNVLIRGERGEDLEEFSLMPSTKLQSCIFQHSNEVSRGTWMDRN